MDEHRDNWPAEGRTGTAPPFQLPFRLKLLYNAYFALLLAQHGLN
jgi:hypothetical protein